MYPVIPVTVLHIEVAQETDWVYMFTFLDPSTNLPVDLTGGRAEMQFRRTYTGNNDNTVVYNLTSDPGGGITLGGTTGTIAIHLPYAKTQGQNIVVLQGVYSLVLISPDSYRMQYAKGFVTIEAPSTYIAQSGLVDQSLALTPPLVQPNNFGIGGVDHP